MYNYALDLATNIINLEYNKTKVISNQNEKQRLCHCRKQILENYITVAQLLYIRITARTIKFLEDGSLIHKTVDTSDLKDWFNLNAYETLFQNPHVSNKMVILFRSLQSLMDDQFFDFFEHKYVEIIKEKVDNGITDESFALMLSEFYRSMFEWLETSIFNILTLKIDCNNLDDSILKDFGIIEKDFCCHNEHHRKNCSNCQDHLCHKAGCRTHELTKDHEDIHLYMIDEMMFTQNWISNYIIMVNKYHKNPKGVKFIFDFKLYDANSPLKFIQDVYNMVGFANDIFKEATIINYGYVDFGQFSEKVKPFLGKR